MENKVRENEDYPAVSRLSVTETSGQFRLVPTFEFQEFQEFRQRESEAASFFMLRSGDLARAPSLYRDVPDGSDQFRPMNILFQIGEIASLPKIARAEVLQRFRWLRG
ncbi:MAG: hypothetical protein ABJF10_26425 [Chthoniobacter sp.]|uniref:hypothetical protein n=1 Tax=Chthoniobacter sp. TaxID=2510640 RepID=UPI0032A36E12